MWRCSFVSITHYSLPSIHELSAMFACTCTIARRLVTTQRLLTTSAVRTDQVADSKGKGSTRLEWDSVNKQWIKKNTASRTAQRRPGPAERARILQELEEQRLNEVTELDPDAKDLAAGDAGAPSNATGSSSTSSITDQPASSVATSTSGRRYMRGQDSSSLQVQTATTLKGVPIPIRPSPPESTDCCMTGCPRCVYDIYTEDLQLHFEAMDKARKELTKKGVPQDQWPVHLRRFAEAATSTAKMKKEDSGSDKSGTVKTYDSDDADGISAFDVAAQVVTDEIQDLDISLRTFLKFERELRQRRKREQAQRLALNHVSSMSSTPSSGSADRPNA